MALQVKKKNIGQPPTRSNPYLNQKDIKYRLGGMSILEDGGDPHPGQLSRSDIEKRLALQRNIAQINALPENRGKRYNWYERNIKNPLEKRGVNTDAIEFGVEGAMALEGAVALGKSAIKGLTKKAIKELPHSEQILKGPVDWADAVNREANPLFDKAAARRYESTIKSTYQSPATGEAAPYIKGPKISESLKSFPPQDSYNYVNMGERPIKGQGYAVDLEDYVNGINSPMWRKDAGKVVGKFLDETKVSKEQTLNMFSSLPKNAIGGMINPYKQFIGQQQNPYQPNVGTKVYDYLNEEGEPEIEDNTEKDNMIYEKDKQLREKDIFIQRLQKSRYEYEQNELALSLANSVPNAIKSGVGEWGKQIINELTQDLGYTPKFNSIFRTPEKQQQLINQGYGVKNSFHLTGDAVDMKPEDWNKLSSNQKTSIRGKYDVINHNNHFHIEPKGSPSK